MFRPIRAHRYVSSVLLLGMVLAAPNGRHLYAQEKAHNVQGTKQDRYNATVHSVSKDTSSFTVRRGTEDREVLYSPQTTITYMNKPSSGAEIQEGRRVICLGKINDKKQLEASQIDIRTGAKEGK